MNSKQTLEYLAQERSKELKTCIELKRLKQKLLKENNHKKYKEKEWNR